jgi:hypothetical protein
LPLSRGESREPEVIELFKKLVGIGPAAAALRSGQAHAERRESSEAYGGEFTEENETLTP